MERLGEYSKTICASGLLSNWNILLRTCWPLVKTKRVTFYGGSPQLYFDSFVKSLAKVLFAQGLGSAQFFTFPQSPNRCHAGGSNLGPVGCQSTPSLSMHWLTAPENPLPHMWQEHSDQSMARSRGHKPRHRWQADKHQADRSRDQRWGPSLWVVKSLHKVLFAPWAELTEPLWPRILLLSW